MGAVIPVQVIESDFSTLLVKLGYQLVYRGKVGELYSVPGKPGQLLMVRSDRLSIFDFVLPCLVPFKGEVLTALTHFWLTNVLSDYPNHLLAWGTNEKLWEAAGWEMADVLKLPLERTLLVKKSAVWPYEMIYRGHIGGSVWNQYQEDGTAGGNVLPQGLSKWQRLVTPIFTPTTKAEGAHDELVDIHDYYRKTGEVGEAFDRLCSKAYGEAYNFAAAQGIVLLDTKFEVGEDEEGRLCFVDETLTTDSSRFTTTADLRDAIAEGRNPVSYDKQPVRDHGMTIETPLGRGLSRLNPENDDNLDFVAKLQIPTYVLEQCMDRYLNIFEMLTGRSIMQYRVEALGLPAYDEW